MSSSVIQVEYEILEEISQRFEDHADDTSAIIRSLSSTMEQLRGGGWAGDAATAFYREMEDELFPTLKRLEAAFSQSSEFTQELIVKIETTEEEAADQFDLTRNSNGGSIGSGGGGGGSSAGGGGGGSATGGGAAAQGQPEKSLPLNELLSRDPELRDMIRNSGIQNLPDDQRGRVLDAIRDVATDPSGKSLPLNERLSRYPELRELLENGGVQTLPGDGIRLDPSGSADIGQTSGESAIRDGIGVIQPDQTLPGDGIGLDPLTPPDADQASRESIIRDGIGVIQPDQTLPGDGIGLDPLTPPDADQASRESVIRDVMDGETIQTLPNDNVDFELPPFDG